MQKAYATMALLAASTLAHGQTSHWIDAPVVQVEPIVEVTSRKIPHEICRTEQVKVVNDGGAHSATPGLLGALVGGVAGGAAGEGRYQPVIAGAGALIGASIGTDYAHRQGAQSYYVNEEHCGTDYELRDIERVVGYRVGYQYEGDVYYTRTATAPGSSIRLRVDVSPEP